MTERELAFEAELAGTRQALSGWLMARPVEQAIEDFSQEFGGPDGREGAIARGTLAALVESEQRELANRAAHLLELLAERAGEAPVALWDRYEEALERQRDDSVTGFSELDRDTPGADAAWTQMVARREGRAAIRQARAIRADLSAAATRAVLLLSGAWLLGMRAWTDGGWTRALLTATGLAIASIALQRALLPQDAKLPEAPRARFALIQPWLLTAALQGGLLYWSTGSARLSFWATVLALAFSVLSWPTSRVIERWRSLGLSPADRERP